MRALDDLTLPTEGSTTLREVLSAALKRLARDLLTLREPALAPVLSVVRGELTREPGRVFQILRRPNVGAAIRVLRGGPNPRLASQLAATLAVELAAAGAELPRLRFEALPHWVLCLGGRFAVPGPAAVLEAGRWTAGGHTVELGAPDERPYHVIAGGLVFATRDDNPLAMNEAHPDKAGNAVNLGGHPPAEWTASLKDALERIGKYLPGVRAEADLLLSQFVPVGFDERAHLSASYLEALGTIYLSLHPQPMTMTEAVIHELSHNKLNALLETGPMLENAFSPLFKSPVRPDPRPLHGVLLAVHAFLPVAELYRRMAEAGAPGTDSADFARRFAAITSKNKEGVDVLRAHAKPTTLGAPLLAEIDRLESGFALNASP